jgi:hypothetical protein
MLSLSICYGQDMTITKYQGSDCRIDATTDGGCENLFIYTYKFVRNKKKIKQTDYNEIKIHKIFSEGKFQIMDSTNIHKKMKPSKLIDFQEFEKMLEIICRNDTNKLIVFDSTYFLSKEYLTSHAKIEIQDTISKIKKFLVSELDQLSYCSVVKRIIVKVSYNHTSYKFIKRDIDTFWSVYNSKSDSLVCRFIYPEWNIMINNLLNTDRNDINHLQIIQVNNDFKYNIEYDIGRKILSPIKK